MEVMRRYVQIKEDGRIVLSCSSHDKGARAIATTRERPEEGTEALVFSE